MSVLFDLLFPTSFQPTISATNQGPHRDTILYRLHPLNHLTPELNTSAQRCLARFLQGILLL
jgi:hypothetical protein